MYESAITLKSYRLTVGLLLLTVVAVLAAASASHAQAPSANLPNFSNDPQIPIPADAGFGPMENATLKQPIAEILSRMAAKENEFLKALNNYTYRRSVKIQTLTRDKVDGEYSQVDDITFESNGKRFERTVFAPQSSLERLILTPEDFDDIRKRIPFVLTTEEIGQYNANYIGQQKVDDLTCYVFDVAPKTMEKGKRYLKARIWVDAQDLQIVITAGKNIPDDVRQGHENLSPPFVTYREQIDGHYWFPIYTRADAVLHFTGGHGFMGEDVHTRQIIKYSDYKRYRATIHILDDTRIVDEGKNPPTKSPK
jgi:hypothetical protein